MLATMTVQCVSVCAKLRAARRTEEKENDEPQVQSKWGRWQNQGSISDDRVAYLSLLSSGLGRRIEPPLDP